MAATTTSTCAPETAKGAHEFRIEGYSMYKGLGVGRSVKSATFAVGGYDWRICYYPDGDVEASKDCISVQLELITEGADVRALYSLKLVRQANGSSAYFMWANPTEPVVFSSARETTARGLSRFAKRSVLEASTYIIGDAIVISCELTVIRLKEAQAPQPEASFVVQVPSSPDLTDDLKKLLETGEEADVSFRVKDEIFHAHKLVLAMRSPVFKAALYGPMGDKCGRSITIEDVHPVAFKALLHFIYTDELPDLDEIDDDEYDEYDLEEMIRHLLVAADRYAMERMKLMCERILSENLDSTTVATTLAFADQYHCSQLKDACIGFINSLDTMDPVLSSTGYEHLKRACPNIFVDIWEKAAKARKN